jgi:hypothetical protein
VQLPSDIGDTDAEPQYRISTLRVVRNSRVLSNFVVGLFEITRSRNIVSKSSGWSEELAEDEVERWCRAGHRVRVFLSSGSMIEDNALSAPKVMIAPALRTNVSTY